MKIYTRAGDTGDTSLFGGTRVPKDSLRVWCYGSADEAMCAIGTARAFLQGETAVGAEAEKEVAEMVRHIQNRLFVVEAELASDESGIQKLKDRINEEDIAYLEQAIDDFTLRHGKDKLFTIPGDTKPSALFHTARVTVRRAERHVVALSREEHVSPFVLQYLNRLSDLMYVLAVYLS